MKIGLFKVNMVVKLKWLEKIFIMKIGVLSKNMSQVKADSKFL